MFTRPDDYYRLCNLFVATSRRSRILGLTVGLSTLCVFSSAQDMSLVGSAKGNYGSVAVQYGYAYVAEGKFIRIVNAKDPSHPKMVGSYELPSSAIQIEVSGLNLYVRCRAATRSSGEKSGFLILNITNPTSPVLLGSYMPGRINDFFVADLRAYIAVPRMGLEILDVPDLTLIRWRDFLDEDTIRKLYYLRGKPPPPSRTDSLRFFSLGTAKIDIVRVDVLGDYAYVLTGGSRRRGSRLLAVDVSEPKRPAVCYDKSISLYGRYGHEIVITGEIAAISWGVHSGLFSGITIFDISKPDEPKLMSEYQFARRYIRLKGFAVCGSMAYVSWSKYYRDKEKIEGLSAVDIFDPAFPFLRAEILLPGEASDRGALAVSGSYAYVTGGKEGLRIVDISPFVGD